jgi:hypothetical protein
VARLSRPWGADFTRSPTESVARRNIVTVNRGWETENPNELVQAELDPDSDLRRSRLSVYERRRTLKATACKNVELI